MRTRQQLNPGPPWGPGYYTEDGRSWWDDDRQRWFHVGSQEDSLEIEVEDFGGTSFPAALGTILISQYGTGYATFVARAHSDDPRWSVYGVTGPTFPMTRMPLDDLSAQGAWAQDMRTRLDEMDRELVQHGWRRAGHGEHWWSLRYTRPVIELPGDRRPADTRRWRRAGR
jgi:hypothetical protein